jgi:ssDNA-specific exonuclease RecJ
VAGIPVSSQRNRSIQESNIYQDKREEGKKEDLQLGGFTVWNKICEFLESKDGEIRHKSKANGKA